LVNLNSFYNLITLPTNSCFSRSLDLKGGVAELKVASHIRMGHVDEVIESLKNNFKDWLSWTVSFYLSLSTILENSKNIKEVEVEPPTTEDVTDSASDGHSDFKVTVSLFQLIIIAQDFKMLQKVLEEEIIEQVGKKVNVTRCGGANKSEEGLFTSKEIIEQVCKPVKVTGSVSGGANKSEEGLFTSKEIIEQVCKPVKVTGSGSGGANKAKVVSEESWIFDATSLHLAAKYLPTGLKRILDTLDTLDTPKMHKALINNMDNDAGYSPLHIAAMKQDSLSTR
jgi:hypothetical protein